MIPSRTTKLVQVHSTPDVHISRFDKDASTSKTAFARSQLAKRFLVNQAQNRPVPVQSLSNTTNTQDSNVTTTNSHETATSLAATLAASVAISVAQPFLKLQSDLEQKMNSVLDQIQQQQTRSTTSGVVVPVTNMYQSSMANDTNKLRTDCVDIRMKYMEKVQEQQQQVLKQLVDMANTTKTASQSLKPYTNVDGKFLCT
jgi:GTP:adenosylcobinamide-phosphate guanylyltransferase